MAQIRTRVARLEQARPVPGVNSLGLDLPSETCARIVAAQAAGTYPQSLPDADLLAILHAHDKEPGQP